MKAFQFFKVDLIRSRAQLKYMLLFWALAFCLGFSTDAGALFTLFYMIFCGVILSGQPFLMDQKMESGFLNMLPGSKMERVAGRYLMSVVLLLAGMILGLISMLVVGSVKGTMVGGLDIFIPLLLEIGLVTIAVQNVCLYAFGKGKSQQVAAIIRMVPGFAVFFGGMGIMDDMESNPSSYQNLWVISHPQMAAWFMLGIGVLAVLAAILISSVIIKKRDYD